MQVLTRCRGVIFCTTNSASDVMLSSALYFPNRFVIKSSKVRGSFLSRSVMPMKFPACSMALRMISSRCSDANKCWERRQLTKTSILLIKKQLERTKCCECTPACWSHHRGCRSPPGNRRSRRIPRHSDSRRNKLPGSCAGRSGRCRQASPPNSQISSCRSSGA